MPCLQFKVANTAFLLPISASLEAINKLVAGGS